MKRDMDLVREILLEVEEKDDGSSMRFGASELSTAKWHHVQLLIKAGLLAQVGIVRANEYTKVHLSWEGHDFLDAIRSEGVWQQTKDAVSETGGSVALELMKSIATALAKKKIEQHTGLSI